MLRSLWLRKFSSALFGRPSTSRKLRRHLRRTRLNLECLENRTLLSGGLPYATPSTSSQLIADINAANTAGGSTTITPKAGAPFDFSTGDYFYAGWNALPDISANITINGKGDTIGRTGVDWFRLFAVASSGSLTLQNMTVSGGLVFG